MTDGGGAGLTPLQHRVLEVLSGIEPPWTLTGGAALVGFHLHHRTTRDLDLFWHGCERLLVSEGSDRVVVDLVAEPVETVEPPEPATLGAVTVLVDTPHEILVNKLCALLGRAELRDLVDVHALINRGEDLVRAVGDAPRKDAGFSAVALAFVLRGLPIDALAEVTGLGGPERREMEDLRDALVEKLLRGTRPGPGQGGPDTETG